MIVGRESTRFAGTIKALSNLQRYKQDQPHTKWKGLSPEIALLRTWQSERLAHTHADLLTSRHYGPACRFFLDQVYAPSDFSQRDHDIEYLYEMMSRFLPEFLLGLVRNASEINNLTSSLDQALLRVLVDGLGVTDEITAQLYAEAYRICDNYAERERQIDLLFEIGRKVDLGTRIPLVGTTLRLARGPAQRAGWGELHDFLERGFSAFKRMRSPRRFLNTIQEREKSILDKIFAGDPNPFSLSDYR